MPLFSKSKGQQIIVTTTFTIEGYHVVSYLGMVRGIVVRSPTIMQGFLAGIKNIVGGQLAAYGRMCEDARTEAYRLMVEHAQALGAHAVVGVCYDASEVVSKASASEVLCYGTAVLLEPNN